MRIFDALKIKLIILCWSNFSVPFFICIITTKLFLKSVGGLPGDWITYQNFISSIVYLYRNSIYSWSLYIIHIFQCSIKFWYQNDTSILFFFNIILILLQNPSFIKHPLPQYKHILILIFVFSPILKKSCFFFKFLIIN